MGGEKKAKEIFTFLKKAKSETCSAFVFQCSMCPEQGQWPHQAPSPGTTTPISANQRLGIKPPYFVSVSIYALSQFVLCIPTFTLVLNISMY